MYATLLVIIRGGSGAVGGYKGQTICLKLEAR